MPVFFEVDQEEVTKLSVQLEQTSKQFDALQTQHQRSVDALYNQQGLPIYSETEHGERMTVLQTQHQAATAALSQRMHDLRANIQTELEAADIDPLLKLTDADSRAEATFKQPIVDRTVQSMPLAALASTLKTITAHGSHIDKVLHLSAARLRMAQEQQKVSAGAEIDPAGRATLVALAALENDLDGGKRGRRNDKLSGLLKDSWSLIIKIGSKSESTPHKIAF